MANIWFISDTHFNHDNILKFTDKDGKKFRGDLFPSSEAMNEFMIQNWNNLIKPSDKVYHLGDVYFGNDQRAHSILSRLNGHKRLILGNHDKLKKDSPLFQHFEKIMLWWPFEQMVFSHLPLREDQFPPRAKVVLNVHGHIHQRPSPSERHHNISVERTNYLPLHLDQLIQLRNKIS